MGRNGTTIQGLGWTAFYLLVVLKIPVIMALWIVWWAINSEPEAADDPRPDDGSGPLHPRPSHPRPPRRGEHAVPPTPPARVRTVKGRRRARTL